MQTTFLGMSNPSLPLGEVLLRVGLAFGAGLLVGYERERHGRAAGLRTTTLVCVSSAVAMVLSEFLFANSVATNGTWRPDPARLAAGILTGMGFLGAGTIIRQRNVIRGVTTAAVLWFVTVLGLAFGSGYVALGVVGLGMAVLTLFILPAIECHVQNDWYGILAVTATMDALQEEEIRARIEAADVKVKRMDMDYDLPMNRKTFRCEVKFKKGRLFELSQKIVHDLTRCPGVTHVRWMS